MQVFTVFIMTQTWAMELIWERLGGGGGKGLLSFLMEGGGGLRLTHSLTTIHQPDASRPLWPPVGQGKLLFDISCCNKKLHVLMTQQSLCVNQVIYYKW